MRDIKELLILLRDNLIKTYMYGYSICVNIRRLYYLDMITSYEWKVLKICINKNKPDEFDNNELWWPINEKQPRIDFLNKLINEL